MNAPLLLVLSSDAGLRSALVGRDHELVVFDDAAEALAAARKRDVWVFVLDARGHASWLEGMLKRVQALPSQPELVLLLDARSAQDPPGLAEIPAENVHRGDFDAEALGEQVRRLLSLQRVRRQSGIVGTAPAIRELLSTVAQVAPLDVPVLIHGESGTGKEMVARALHEQSRRADRPFVSINVGSLAETLLESELFGHEKGAFTGAVARRPGVFERADGGTLFLDELGEMSAAMQVKLLRVLETTEFQRVGGSETLRSDVRVVAATHRDLEKEMAAGRFRSDLYYRLKVVKIDIPPLRERPDDILLLAQNFLEEANERHGLRRRGFTLEAMQRLRRYAWPGNVRELRNVVSSMAVLGTGDHLGIEDLPEELREGAGGPRSLPLPATAGWSADGGAADGLLTNTLLALVGDLRKAIDRLDAIEERLESIEEGLVGGPSVVPRAQQRSRWEEEASEAEFTPLSADAPTDLAGAERALIQATLRQFDGNRRETAEQLGISERTLYRKLKEYGLH